jgi:hypothetical protein
MTQAQSLDFTFTLGSVSTLNNPLNIRMSFFQKCEVEVVENHHNYQRPPYK